MSLDSSTRAQVVATAVVAILVALAPHHSTAGDPVLVVPGQPVPISLTIELPKHDIEFGNMDTVALTEIGGDEASTVGTVMPSVQADGTVGEGFRLATVIPAARTHFEQRRFRLASRERHRIGFSLKELNAKSLRMDDHRQRPVFAYNHGVIVRDDLPKNEHRRSRSCYIHPVWGLHGEVLTDDFPKDHYHHHGVFWTWPYIDLPDDDRGPYDSWQG